MELRPASAFLNWSLFVRRRAFGAFLAALLLYALWPWLPGLRATPTRTIVFYGFGILGEVMNEGIFPAFQALYRDEHGEKVEFSRRSPSPARSRIRWYCQLYKFAA